MFIVSSSRKKYTPEYRQEAARLVIESGRPIADVAKEIGVGEGLLGRWVKLDPERRVLGWFMGSVQDSYLVERALRMA